MNPYLFTNKINLKTLTFGSNNGEYYKYYKQSTSYLTSKVPIRGNPLYILNCVYRI